VVLDCELSAKQREQHLELIQAARAASGDSRMKFIWEVMRLYQHPALVPRYEPVMAKAAVQDCPKLEAVVRKLRDIERRGEKALIFTRHLDMQQLLAEVLSSEFNLTVDILNGSTSRSPTGGRVANTRSAIVKRFRETRGFNLIVLSPDVAGLGLNLVEANHVFHYGRWWNPAKEAQATDRVYRIGQTKDVFVYHPVARDPLGQFKTFDEKLHEILDRRRSLASEFLAPIPNESALEAELFENVLSQGAASDAQAANPISVEDIRRFTPSLFEALIALLLERSGADILLTPYERDEGIDVIGIKEFEIRLVQCRHMLSVAVVTVEAAKEVIEAFNGYRARRLNQASKGRALVPALVTNGSALKSTRNYAQEKGLQIIERQELMRLVVEARLSLLEVEAMEHRRLASMPEVQAALDSNRHQ
jgi:hypothetical protein